MSGFLTKTATDSGQLQNRTSRMYLALSEYLPCNQRPPGHPGVRHVEFIASTVSDHGDSEEFGDKKVLQRT